MKNQLYEEQNKEEQLIKSKQDKLLGILKKGGVKLKERQGDNQNEEKKEEERQDKLQDEMTRNLSNEEKRVDKRLERKKCNVRLCRFCNIEWKQKRKIKNKRSRKLCYENCTRCNRVIEQIRENDLWSAALCQEDDDTKRPRSKPPTTVRQEPEVVMSEKEKEKKIEQLETDKKERSKRIQTRKSKRRRKLPI